MNIDTHVDGTNYAASLGFAHLAQEVIEVLILRVREDTSRVTTLWSQLWEALMLLGAACDTGEDAGRLLDDTVDEIGILALAYLAAEEHRRPFDAVEGALTPAERQAWAGSVDHFRGVLEAMVAVRHLDEAEAPLSWRRLRRFAVRPGDENRGALAASSPLVVRHDVVARLHFDVDVRGGGRAGRVEVLLGSGDVDVRQLDGIPLRLRGIGELSRDGYLPVPDVPDGTDLIDWLSDHLADTDR